MTNLYSILALVAVCAVAGCKSPKQWRQQADKAAYEHVEHASREAGRAEPFTIERPADTLRRRLLLDQRLPISTPASLGTRSIEPIPQWPDKEDYLTRPAPENWGDVPVPKNAPVTLSLLEALKVAAANSRDFQSEKEDVFRAALSLDLEADDFRNTWSGLLEAFISTDLNDDGTTSGVRGSAEGGLSRQLKNGATITSFIALDLVKLLSDGRSQSFGLAWDGSLSIPLLRGSGRFVVTEPLTQAQRNVIYAIYDFERFKRVFAVRVATDYLGVLQQKDQLINAENNYRRLVGSTRRALRLADAGRLPEIQVDQSRQDELRARNRWISAQASYESTLDRFKISLGLPTDATIALDDAELARLSEAYSHLTTTPQRRTEAPPADAPIVLVPPSREDAGPYELMEDRAIDLALGHRVDLRVAIGRIFDSQRAVAVAADDLRADLTLLGSASAGGSRSVGSATSDDARLRPERGTYSALISLDLPLERTSERNFYRNELIDLERSVRSAQQLEDSVKQDVRNNLRGLLESRETMRIQAEAVRVAQRRVESTDMFLQAGQAQIRDVLEAQEDLISAQNALTSAVVRYRIAELAMQRDMGVLDVSDHGLWREYNVREDADNGDA